MLWAEVLHRHLGPGDDPTHPQGQRQGLRQGSSGRDPRAHHGEGPHPRRPGDVESAAARDRTGVPQSLVKRDGEGEEGRDLLEVFYVRFRLLTGDAVAACTREAGKHSR